MVSKIRVLICMPFMIVGFVCLGMSLVIGGPASRQIFATVVVNKMREIYDGLK